MSNVTTRSVIYTQDPDKPNNPRAKIPTAQVVSTLNSNNGNISVQVISDRGVILHSGTSSSVVKEIKQYGYDKEDPEKYGKILETVERNQTSLTTEYQKIVAETKAEARAEAQESAAQEQTQIAQGVENRRQQTDGVNGQTPSLPPQTSATILTVSTPTGPVAAERVVSVLDRNTGQINTQVISPEGVIVHSGSPQQVASEVSRTSESPNKDQILSAVQKQDSNLTQSYQKQTSAATVQQAQENTGQTPDKQPVGAEAAAKIEKGNQPPAETPAPSTVTTSPPAPAQTTPPAQQPTVGNNEDRAPTEQETRRDPTAQQNQTPRAAIPGESNPLDNYASYTYNFILAALDPKEEYNKMVSDPTYKYQLKNVLIASGARNDKINYPRDPRFLAEFFIDDVKFDTIVGLNARNKSSNALALSFTIREPYGVTFFDRLYELSLANPKYRNYIEIPYLLIIEFVGYTDDGRPVKLANDTKYIPIKLIYSSLKVTGAGSEYQCQAVPFNQMSQMANEHGSTPVNVQVTAKNVAEFFAELQGDSITTQYQNDRSEARSRIASIENVDAFDVFADKPVTQEDIRKAQGQIEGDFRKKYYNAKSYPQALDAFQRLIVEDKKAEHKNIYRFVIDPKIGESTLYTPAKTPSNRQQFNNDTRTGANEGNKEIGEGAIFNINGGTSVIDVINTVMRNSSFIRNQIVGSESAEKELARGSDAAKIAEAGKKPINWFKITSVVKLLDYDEQRNTFAKEIIFYIDPYTVYNTRSPLVPKSFPNNWVQEYNYIFTGDNRSILDLDLKFDTLFNVLATVNPNKWKAMNFGPASPGDTEVDYNTSSAKSFMPTKFVPQAGNVPDQIGNNSSETATNIKVGDLYNTILSSSAADMIQVDLTIVGDPRYIKQDDVLYNSSNSSEIKTNLSTRNNSYVFDYEERYVRLKFKTPTDYDPVTGLLSKTNYTVSRFSGLYRIIRVENSFSKGKFTQVLQLVRLANQPDDYPAEDNKKQDGRTSPTASADIWGGVDPFGGLTVPPDQRNADIWRGVDPFGGLNKPVDYLAEYNALQADKASSPSLDQLYPPIGSPETLPTTFSVVEDIDQGDGTYALWDNKTGTYAQRGLSKQDAETSAKSFNISSRDEFNKPTGVTDQDKLMALRLSQESGQTINPSVLAAQRKAALQAEVEFQANQQSIRNEIAQQRLDGINFFADLDRGLQEDRRRAGKPLPNRDDF